MTFSRMLLGVLAVFSAVATRTGAQGDSVTLASLQDAAVRRDPRNAQLDLLASQSRLRLRNIASENLPAIGVNGQAQYQSTVANIPLMLPGVSIPQPPHDTYDASVSVRQRLLDPSLPHRRSIENAQLNDLQSRVRASLFPLRQQVSDVYFQVLELQTRRRDVETVVADLEAQNRVAAERVSAGAALASEARILEAELIRRKQVINQLAASSNAAIEVLRALTRLPIPAGGPFTLPDDRQAVANARMLIEIHRSRPEYAQFESSRELIDRQRAAIGAKELPRISGFARAGYGRPGLNPLASEFDSYWLTGLQLEWNPWTWRATTRERQVLALQRHIVDTEEAAFSEAIRRFVIRDLAEIDRLEASLDDDARIVELRESVMRETRARYREGVVTSAEYIDRQTDALSARIALSAHRIELAQARSRFLTTLGLEAR